MNDLDRLSVVAEQFKDWRTTRSKLGKVPERLRQQTAALVGSYSLSQICRSLHLSSQQVKSFHREFASRPTRKPEFAVISSTALASHTHTSPALPPLCQRKIELELVGADKVLQLKVDAEQLLNLWPQLLASL